MEHHEPLQAGSERTELQADSSTFEPLIEGSSFDEENPSTTAMPVCVQNC
jgi:hypothetical protein